MPRDKETVSRNMRRIKSKDTSIELALRKALWHEGYRYRKNYKKLPGTPDIVITKYKLVIFCDSEFFHGKDWDVLKPRLEAGNNPEFWVHKIERNRSRDMENDRKLLFLGWTVIHFWGKDIMKHTDECLRVIKEVIFDIELNSFKTEFDYMNSGGTDSELLDSGRTDSELMDSEHGDSELMDSERTDSELMDSGHATSELLDSGHATSELLDSGQSESERMSSDYAKEDGSE